MVATVKRPPAGPRPVAVGGSWGAVFQAQEGRIGEQLWREWLPLPALTESGAEIARYLISQGFVNGEDGMLFIGPEAEAKFGRRHFMDLMASFTAPPEFTVLHGRAETWSSVSRIAGSRLMLPDVDEKALAGLKFSVALPPRLAVATLSVRLADFERAGLVLSEPVRFQR